MKYLNEISGSIIAWSTGVAMVLSGREIGGAIVLSSSFAFFIVFMWHHRADREMQLDHRECELDRREDKLREFETLVMTDAEYDQLNYDN